MLYKHSYLPLGYVLRAFPVTALVGGHEEVTADDVMVCDVLEKIKVDGCLGRWTDEHAR
jgi:hypothetical protein